MQFVLFFVVNMLFLAFVLIILRLAAADSDEEEDTQVNNGNQAAAPVPEDIPPTLSQDMFFADDLDVLSIRGVNNENQAVAESLPTTVVQEIFCDCNMDIFTIISSLSGISNLEPLSQQSTLSGIQPISQEEYSHRLTQMIRLSGEFSQYIETSRTYLTNGAVVTRNSFRESGREIQEAIRQELERDRSPVTRPNTPNPLSSQNNEEDVFAFPPRNSERIAALQARIQGPFQVNNLTTDICSRAGPSRRIQPLQIDEHYIPLPELGGIYFINNAGQLLHYGGRNMLISSPPGFRPINQVAAINHMGDMAGIGHPTLETGIYISVRQNDVRDECWRLYSLMRGGELYIPPEDLPLEQRNIDGIINRSYNTNFTFEHDNGELENVINGVQQAERFYHQPSVYFMDENGSILGIQRGTRTNIRPPAEGFISVMPDEAHQRIHEMMHMCEEPGVTMQSSHAFRDEEEHWRFTQLMRNGVPMRRTAPNLATVRLHEDCPTNLNQTVWTHVNISMREMQILLDQSHQRPSNNPGPSGQPIDLLCNEKLTKATPSTSTCNSCRMEERIFELRRELFNRERRTVDRANRGFLDRLMMVRSELDDTLQLTTHLFDDTNQNRINQLAPAVWDEIREVLERILSSTGPLMDMSMTRGTTDAEPPRVIECRICFNYLPTVRLTPCGHTLCPACSLRLYRCPFCRQLVLNRSRLFFDQ